MQRSIFAAKSLSGVFAKRAFSDAPRMTIARNILQINAVRAAKDEEALNAALKANYTMDPNALPAEIAALGPYFSASPAAAGAEEFVPDKTAWQNMSFTNFVMVESQRDETWPFIVGGIITFYIFVVWFPSKLSEEGKKDSPYVQMYNRQLGIVPADHHDGHGHH